MVTLTLLASSTTSCTDTPPPAGPTFDQLARQKSVTVYPALVWGGAAEFDHDAARSLASFVSERTTGNVDVSDATISPEGISRTRVRDRVKIAEASVARHLSNHPMQSDWGFWPVYIFAPGTSQAVEVHALLFDQRGTTVRRFTVNQFKRPPRTPQACTEVLKQTIVNREKIYGQEASPNGR
jgi:hypothetical protein